MTEPRGTGLPRRGPSAAAHPAGAAGSAATGSAATAAAAGPTGADALEHSIGQVLTVGTYVSVVLLAAGVLLLLAAGIGPLSGGPAFDLGSVVGDVAAFRPAGFIWVGLLVVVATPSARVAASLVGYVRRGERTMTVVSVLILIVIAVSVALAKGLEG